MVDITNYTDSESQEKVVQIESNDQFRIKEKFKVSALNNGDTMLLSAVEFSKDSNYENSISLTLTKNEFFQFMQLAKTFFQAPSLGG